MDTLLKAKTYRQLGWLYFYSDELNRSSSNNNNNTTVTITSFCSPLRLELRELAKPYGFNLNTATSPPVVGLQKGEESEKATALKASNAKCLSLCIDYLTKSAQLDPSQNLTWYYLGRALACRGSSREAFVAYKNSVNNPEASSDTWASIGVLYAQQKQHMDALQAFVCAIQLERAHFAAWLNLGMLYEQDGQWDEAFKCYKSALKIRLGHTIGKDNKSESEPTSDFVYRKLYSLFFELNEKKITVLTNL